MTTKQCTKCGEVKLLDCFRNDRAQCRTCDCRRQKKYRDGNREQILEKKAAYRNANASALLASKSRYREANREVLQERGRRDVANLVPSYVAASLQLSVAQCPAEWIEKKRAAVSLKRAANAAITQLKGEK